MASEAKVFGWPAVIAAMIGFYLVVGLVSGLLGAALSVPSGIRAGLVGVFCGLTAPLLVARMRPAQ